MIFENTRCRRPQSHAVIVAAVALCAALLPAVAQAHGTPAPLDFWGAFGRRVARCQRSIGRAAAVCALRAWEAQRSCRLGNLHGTPCDADATKAAVEAARRDAVGAVRDGCSEQEALTLVFLGINEAQADVVRFCRQLERAAVSAVFLPVGTSPAPPATVRCVSAAALATTKLMRRAFASREHLLDRIAQRAFAPAEKQTMLGNSTAAITDAAAALELGMNASCTDDEFVQAYGRDATDFLALIASRADCLGGATYAQGGVVCPAFTCGNGMVEGDALREEQCDDGNTVAGDGCSAACTRE